MEYGLPHCGHFQVVVRITEIQNAMAKTISVGKYIQEIKVFRYEFSKR